MGVLRNKLRRHTTIEEESLFIPYLDESSNLSGSTNEFKIPHKVRDFFVYAELLKAYFHKAKCEQKNRCGAADFELSAWEHKRSA
jgi:hypothetical protein